MAARFRTFLFARVSGDFSQSEFLSEGEGRGGMKRDRSRNGKSPRASVREL
jgi:hypothetical protein